LFSHVKEEHRLRVLKNRGLGKAVVSKREEQNRMHTEKPHAFNSQPNIMQVSLIKEDRMKKACDMYGEEHNCIHDYGRKP
jgi:hypothetical protein